MYEYKTIKLGQILKEANHNECPLFLAVENGSGANDKNIHIVINPRIKLQASRWIQHQYLNIYINKEHLNQTSI